MPKFLGKNALRGQPQRPTCAIAAWGSEAAAAKNAKTLGKTRFIPQDGARQVARQVPQRSQQPSCRGAAWAHTASRLRLVVRKVRGRAAGPVCAVAGPPTH